MENILIYIVVFALAFWAGFRINEWIMLAAFNKLIEELGISEDQLRTLAKSNGLDLPEPEPTLPTLTPIEIRIVQIDGQLYAYRLDDDQFLAQGPDREALIQRLTENLTNVKIIIDRENGADYIT